MSRPLVSVITPVYEVKEYLAECIDSILGQSYTELELILIDDGSTDGSGDVCDEYAKSDDRVKVIHQQNKGVSAARNRGLDAASGEYVLFVDGDDVARHDLVSGLLRGFEYESVGMTACRFTKFTDIPEYHPLRTSGDYTVLSRREALTEVFYGGRIDSGPFCKMIKRSVLGNRRFDEKHVIGEDLDLLCKLLADERNFEVRFTEREMYGYRMRQGSAMATEYGSKYVDYLDLVVEWGDKLVEKYPTMRRAVAYRSFGVASYCAGKIGKKAHEYQQDLAKCNGLMKQHSVSVLFDTRTKLKNRCLALAYAVNVKFAAWLRRVI